MVMLFLESVSLKTVLSAKQLKPDFASVRMVASVVLVAALFVARRQIGDLMARKLDKLVAKNGS